MKHLFLLALSFCGCVSLSAQISKVDSLEEVLKAKLQNKQVLSAEIQKISSGGLMFSTKKLDKKMEESRQLNNEIQLLHEQISAEKKAGGYYKRLNLKNETSDTITVKILDYVKFMNWYNVEQLRIEQDSETITNADERYRYRNKYQRLKSLIEYELDLTYENVYKEIGDQTPYLEVQIPPLPPKELTPYEKKLLTMQKEKAAMIAGWEWVDDKDKANWEKKDVAYPEQYSFYVHKEHPEYQIKFRNLIDDGRIFPLVFDENELIRINEINRDYLPMDKIKKAVFKKDFLANKYNVTDENVREFIKWHLGMPSKLDVIGSAAVKQMRQHKAEQIEATTLQEARQAAVSEEKVRNTMGAVLSTKEAELAENYIKQLDIAHEKDWEIASVTRKSGTSFEVLSASGLKIVLTFFAEINSHENYSNVEVEILED